MEVFATIAEVRACLQEKTAMGLTVGFVPTMGALHRGHLSLLEKAREENNVAVCSIFVNPIQFNNKNDLKKYPRDIDKDLKLLKEIGCDVVFHPSEEEMYPEPVKEEIDLGGLDEVLEGKYRPGHFRGVVIVVRRLFEIIRPGRAYFGQKDYQQLVIIHHMVTKLNLPVEIVPCPTVREKDGLAMSSRNARLSKAERKRAPLIYNTLKLVKVHAGYTGLNDVKNMVMDAFRRDRIMELEYFEIVDMKTLRSVSHWTQSQNLIACIAAYAGDVRLIDNIVIFS